MKLALLFGIALTNYQLARFLQEQISVLLPSVPWIVMLSAVWILLTGSLALLFYRYAGVIPRLLPIRRSWRALAFLSFLTIAGLVLFSFLGITDIFAKVRYPLFFFLVTPIAEELLFRGWIYGQLEKSQLYPVIGSAVLFGLHHLQYTMYRPTPFAIFQIGYTCVLGILFGYVRKKSDSIYLSLALHIFINWASVYW